MPPSTTREASIAVLKKERIPYRALPWDRLKPHCFLIHVSTYKCTETGLLLQAYRPCIYIYMYTESQAANLQRKAFSIRLHFPRLPKQGCFTDKQVTTEVKL